MHSHPQQQLKRQQSRIVFPRWFQSVVCIVVGIVTYDHVIQFHNNMNVIQHNRRRIDFFNGTSETDLFVSSLSSENKNDLVSMIEPESNLLTTNTLTKYDIQSSWECIRMVF